MNALASTQSQTEDHEGYFNRLRTDVLALVPVNTRKVLSVGCGRGATEAELIKRGISVSGIELDLPSAEVARSRGLRVFQGDASEVDYQLGSETFDCLIYADVLEHIPDPLRVLTSHVKRLDPGGSVLISVPNFRHYEVLRALFVAGHVKYADAGILDRTHLRLTTRKMVEEWLISAGLVREAVVYRMSRRREKLINSCSLGLLQEFVARQVILVGRKAS